MKKILGLFAICLSFSAFAGNNDIYITQTGTGLTLTIDQIGATNTVGTSSSRATLSGTSMTVDIDQIGDSNVLSWTQGAASTATGANNDFAITGTSNSVTGVCEVVGCINNWDIDGNSNTITTLQTGSADHAITVALTGSSNTVTIDQTDTASTNVANIISTTSSGTINVDQCASGC